jgi:hypothetical protein
MLHAGLIRLTGFRAAEQGGAVALCVVAAIFWLIIADEKAHRIVDKLTNVPNLSRGQLEYLDVLSVFLESYENEHHRIDVS